MSHWTYFLSLVTLPLTYPNPFDRYGTPTPAFHVSTTEIGCTRVCVCLCMCIFVLIPVSDKIDYVNFILPCHYIKLKIYKYTHFIMD